ncbi:NAD(P)-dependent oxidoreductase [Paenibacillus caseinilyticus]
MGKVRIDIKTIALIGGTGRVGRHIAATAVQKGYGVRLLRRSPGAEAAGGMEVIGGDARDRKSLRMLLAGCHAVINAYGQSPKGEQLYSEVTREILALMKEGGIPRYIGVTGGSLVLPHDRRGLFNRTAAGVFRMMYPEMIAAKEKEYGVIAGSEAKWTLVRLPFVSEGAAAGKIKVSHTSMPGYRITNGAIASFLVDQVTDPSHVGMTPFIAN